MYTPIKSEYWWVILPGSILFAWILSKTTRYFNRVQPPSQNRSSEEPQVLFSSDGRSGKVHYQSREGNFDMYYEFGGGDVLAIINVPSAQQWVAITNIPLQKRMETLHFIGQKTVELQTQGGKGSYEIEGDCILIHPQSNV